MPSVAHKALRPIAIFEAFKGAVILITGFGLLSFLGRDNELYAEQIIRHLHLDPAQHYARIFILAVGQQSDSQLMVYASFAAIYAVVRFAEAYGLWYERRWAEWLAALSGGIYVPVELFDLLRRPSWLRFGVLVVNLAVVAYMVWLLTESRRRRIAAEKLANPNG